jgi:Predicted transcriptional regulator
VNTNDHNNLRLIRLPEVMSMVALRRSSIYGLIGKGQFPAPRKIGRASVWSSAEVQQWIEAILQVKEASDQQCAPVEKDRINQVLT